MYAIWWLSQQDCEQIESAIRWPTDEDIEPRETIAAQLSIPVYIAAEFRSRQGRAGRGRLWIPPEIDAIGVPWDDDDPICAMASVCGGIVIHAEHIPAIISLPGFVTDMKMQLWKL